MRQGLGVGQVVDRDEIDVRILDARPHDEPPDAAEAVDAYVDRHSDTPFIEDILAI